MRRRSVHLLYILWPRSTLSGAEAMDTPCDTFKLSRSRASEGNQHDLSTRELRVGLALQRLLIRRLEHHLEEPCIVRRRQQGLDKPDHHGIRTQALSQAGGTVAWGGTDWWYLCSSKSAQKRSSIASRHSL
jgi:hypothetical protein